ncbi:MAG: 4a-hydroxytetrahydrobiopterin dehydratase [Caulobacteraceae bacterium]
MPKLPLIDPDAACAELPGWSRAPAREAIFKTYRFPSFTDAFGFMREMAAVAETMDHHPDWRNTYKTVKVLLTTHSSGGVTRLDVDMARRMNEAADRLGAS